MEQDNVRRCKFFYSNADRKEDTSFSEKNVIAYIIILLIKFALPLIIILTSINIKSQYRETNLKGTNLNFILAHNKLNFVKNSNEYHFFHNLTILLKIVCLPQLPYYHLTILCKLFCLPQVPYYVKHVLYSKLLNPQINK